MCTLVTPFWTALCSAAATDGLATSVATTDLRCVRVCLREREREREGGC